MDMLSIGSEHSVRKVWSGVIKPRKKRNALSLGEKLKVIEQLEQGGSQREIAITMGVSKTQIQQIHCSSELICKAIQETAIPMQSKLKTPRAHNPELDQSVYDWFCKMCIQSSQPLQAIATFKCCYPSACQTRGTVTRDFKF